MLRVAPAADSQTVADFKLGYGICRAKYSLLNGTYSNLHQSVGIQVCSPLKLQPPATNLGLDRCSNDPMKACIVNIFSRG